MHSDIKNFWKKPTAHQITVHDYLSLMSDIAAKRGEAAREGKAVLDHWEQVSQLRLLMHVDYGVKRPEDFIKVTGINPA